MKSSLERSGRGADGVVDETGLVRASLMIKALLTSKPRSQGAAGRELSSYTSACWVLAGRGGGQTRSKHSKNSPMHLEPSVLET